MRSLWCYGTWVVALIAVYLAVPALQAPAVCLLGLSVLVVIVARVVSCRPARKLPWLVLAAAAMCFAASGIVLPLRLDARAHVPYLHVADVVGLAIYPLLAAGLGLFARSRRSGGGRRGLIDAVAVTAGLAMLVWLFQILPAVFNPGFPGRQEAVTIAASAGQVAVLLGLALLLAPGAVRHWPVRLLAGGAACALVGSVMFSMLGLYLVYTRLFFLGWAACFALAGAAAIHPAMRELTQPAGPSQNGPSRTRLITLTATSLVPPVLLILNGPGSARGTAFVMSTIFLWLLGQAWLWVANISYLRSLRRERALHAAGSLLAAASSVEEITEAVRSAVQSGFGAGSGRAAVFATCVSGDARVEMTTGGQHQPITLATEASGWLPAVMTLLAGRQEPVLLSAEELRSVAGAGERRTRDDDVMLCPVSVKGYPPGDSLYGVLALFGERRSLLERWSSAQILTSEVGLAMERVLLTDELVRREGQELFRELVQDASDAFLILDDDDTVQYASPSARDIFGDIPLVGVDLWRLSAATYREPHLGVLGAPDEFSELWRLRRHDGRTVRVRAKHSDRRATPSVQGRVLTLRDVTEQRRLQDQLRHRAFHDPLTGMPNRSSFTDRAKQALSIAHKTGTVTAVLFMDVVDFKEVNDILGHVVGDELLTSIGRRLTELARVSDTVARVGGDEFALLIEGLTAPAAADSVAERVVAAFAEPFALSCESVAAGVTVGIATSSDSEEVDELMRHADLAQNAARAGEKPWQRYSPELSQDLQRRRDIRRALEQAINDSALTLAYQPIVALGSGQIAGFESLVRWPHPERGLLTPGHFIDIAEDTGLIVPLGSWVLRRALTDLAAELETFAGASAGRPYVAVNVSARQFRTEGFADSVSQALEATGFPPDALLLEITEGALLKPGPGGGATLAELKRLGVRLAIDDFGTGYSCLSYLQELPIDVLKIDKSFVDGIAASQRRLALTSGIAQIAQTLGVMVVAEGIETTPQRDLLTEMGCDYGQGYLLAKPMPWGEARDLLRGRRPLTPVLPDAV